ncbi:MAG: sigma-70 family RNA polymerase sigma factor, partial [Caulobacteraceae bacterium]
SSRRSKDEDLDAFQRELIDLTPRLRRFARTLARDAAEADDLVQTGLERALRRRASFKEGTRLDAWMFAILKNAWIDEARSRRRGARVIASGVEVESLGSAAEASTDPLERTRIERALLSLPEDQRLAVVLVLVEGLSYGEAAQALGVPQGTLTSRLGRGRAQLMAELEEVGQ